MKIAYNPSDVALTATPDNNDITFDPAGIAVYARGVKFSGTDIKVTQTETSTNNNYEVLFSGNANSTTETTTARKSAKLTFNPSTGNLSTNTLQGNLDGQYINALTNYEKAVNITTISTTDSLNEALGKLELKADTAYNWITSVTDTDVDTKINKWGEIVDFLDSVAAGTDITDEFVTRKTTQTIIGHKTFQADGTVFTDGTNGVRLVGHGGSGWLQLGQTSGENKVHHGKISGISAATLTSLTVSATASSFSGTVTATSLITKNGTSSQFVKGDGSLDSNTYATTSLLSSYVTLTGNQTITGTKTFTKAVTIEVNGNHGLYVKNKLTTQDWTSIGMTCQVQKADKTTEEHTGYFVYKGNADYYLTNPGWYNNYLILHSGNYSNYLPYLNSDEDKANRSSIIYAPTTGGTAGQLLQASGGAPTWIDRSNVSVGNLLGGKPGSLVYQSAVNTTSFLDAPTTNNCVLKYDINTKKPYWILDNSFATWEKQFDTVTLSTEWQDLFSFKDSGFTSGTYCVQLYIRQTACKFYNCFYSGIMSLHMTTSVNDLESNSEEILLHYSGHHTEHRIYLRLKTQPGSDWPKLQIACSYNWGTVSTISDDHNQFYIKLKQLI